MKQSNAKIRFTGQVTSGGGTGKFFVGQEKYKQQFMKANGYIPFEGTLNIKIKDKDITNLLRNSKGLLIKGFRQKNRQFGQVKCLPCNLTKNQKKIKGTIVLPQKSRYVDIIEIISSRNLRKELDLKDDDLVEVTLNV